MKEKKEKGPVKPKRDRIQIKHQVINSPRGAGTYHNYSLFVPTPIGELIPDEMRFKVELTARGILYVPIKDSKEFPERMESIDVSTIPEWLKKEVSEEVLENAMFNHELVLEARELALKKAEEKRLEEAENQVA